MSLGPIGSAVLPSGRSTRGRTRAPGFTFFELMVVIVIISTMSALAVPKIWRGVRIGRTRNAQTVVAGELQAAIALAAQRRTPTVVVWNSSVGALQVRSAGSTSVRTSRFMGSGSEYNVTISLTQGGSAADSMLIHPSSLTVPTCFKISSGTAPDTVVRRVSVNRAAAVRLVPEGQGCP